MTDGYQGMVVVGIVEAADRSLHNGGRQEEIKIAPRHALEAVRHSGRPGVQGHEDKDSLIASA